MGRDHLEVSLNTVNDKVRFSAAAGENPEVFIDYFPPLGDGEGYTSLELLLISFASCASTTVLGYLRSILKKSVSSLQAKAAGDVRADHPKVLRNIDLSLTIQSEDVAESDVEMALKAAETRLCPVWAMLKGNVEIHIGYTIERQNA